MNKRDVILMLEKIKEESFDTRYILEQRNELIAGIENIINKLEGERERAGNHFDLSATLNLNTSDAKNELREIREIYNSINVLVNHIHKRLDATQNKIKLEVEINE